MVDKPKPEGSKYPTLMKNFETDEDLDEYVIDHAYMFVVIQIRPGGFVNGYGSNYTRTEFMVEDYDGDQRKTLDTALARGQEIFEETKKALLIYAVANFAGALGFNRPVRQIPAPTFRSKADQRRDEARARKQRRLERERTKAEGAKPKPVKPKLKAQVFKTEFKESAEAGLTDEEFLATDKPLARLHRD
jgi:hypothetical protein